MSIQSKNEITEKQCLLIQKKRGRAIKKSELAIIYNVSPRTMTRYLNERDFEELNEKCGYKKNSVYVSPEVVNYYIYGWIENSKNED